MIDVVVEAAAWRRALPRVASLAKSAAVASLKSEDRGAASLAILLTGDDQMRGLNARFRAKNMPTNVLSFPAPAGPDASPKATLGDIALALGVCQREATEQGKTLADHVAHLTAHGVLHLLGYDHETDADAEVMEAKERAILAGLGVPDPYAERGDHG